MAIIDGDVLPLRDNVMIREMHFGEMRTKSGLIIVSDDGESRGIKPRWGQIVAIGPKQIDVSPGEWVLVEHGRWTRAFDMLGDDGDVYAGRMVDPKDILLCQTTQPNLQEYYRNPDAD